VIFPVPVTLKRFLALEFVLTFGIPVKCYLVKPLRRPAQAGTYRASSGNSIPQIREWGRKDRDEKAKMPPCSGLNFKNPVKIPRRDMPPACPHYVWALRHAIETPFKRLKAEKNRISLQIPLFHLLHGIIRRPCRESHIRQ
jgi:hypothetical protein